MAEDHPPVPHGEFEKLAVEHVLGGLDADVSSRFREHLIGCRDCRQRVAELRGIASDLQVAEREERAVVRIQVETARRDPPPQAPEGQGPRLELVRALGVVLGAILLAVLAFWNVHLREVRSAMQASLDARAAVLETLVEGDLLAVEVEAQGVRALVARDRDTVAIDASGLPGIVDGQRVVVWNVDAEGRSTPIAFVAAGSMPEGRLALHADGADGVRLLVTVETFPLGAEPSSQELFSVELT